MCFFPPTNHNPAKSLCCVNPITQVLRRDKIQLFLRMIRGIVIVNYSIKQDTVIAFPCFKLQALFGFMHIIKRQKRRRSLQYLIVFLVGNFNMG